MKEDEIVPGTARITPGERRTSGDARGKCLSRQMLDTSEVDPARG